MTTLLLLALLSGPTAQPAPAAQPVPSLRKLVITYSLANAADLGMTEWALATVPPNRGREVNPFMAGSSSQRAALKLASIGVCLWASEKTKRDHPKFEKWMRYSIVAVQVAFAANAGRIAWKERRGR